MQTLHEKLLGSLPPKDDASNDPITLRYKPFLLEIPTPITLVELDETGNVNTRGQTIALYSTQMYFMEKIKIYIL